MYFTKTLRAYGQMPMIRVCLAGATGAVGRALAPAIYRSRDMRLVGAVSRSKKGRDLGGLVGIPKLKLTISGSVEEALQSDADVLIDFTSPRVVKANVMFAISKGVHVVIGTSGLTEEDHEEIDRAARKRKVGVLAGGNFAVSAVLMQHFALTAAKVMPSWEIIEYAGEAKPDAPSGTSRELAHAISEIRPPKVSIPVGKTLGVRESRGASMRGTQVHSVRLPGFVSRVDAIFGDTNERLTITHEAGPDQGTYVRGVLLAARKVPSWVGLKRGLWEVMDLPES
jgi:4-hydroxy-tetrahydrodipicolinate reductase